MFKKTLKIIAIIMIIPLSTLSISFSMDSSEVSDIISHISGCELKSRQVPMGFNFYPITIYTPGIGVYDKSEIKEVLADGTEVDFLGQIPSDAITDDGKIIGIFIDFDNSPPFLNVEELKGDENESPGIWVQAIRTYYCDQIDFDACVNDGTVKEFPSLSDALKAGMKKYRMYTFWKIMRFINNSSPEDVSNMDDIIKKNEEQKSKTGIDNFEFYRVYKKIFVPLGGSISIISLKKENIIKNELGELEFKFSEGLRYYDFGCVMTQLQMLQNIVETTPEEQITEPTSSTTETANEGALETPPAIPSSDTSSTTTPESTTSTGTTETTETANETTTETLETPPAIPAF